MLGVVQPVDFTALAEPQIVEVVALAERVLNDRAFARSAADSRNLWLQFLLSPGGEFYPNRNFEIAGMFQKPEDYSGLVDVPTSKSSRNRTPGKMQVSKAGILCAHDVFDAVLLLKVGELLHAAVCDWQMYAPLYSHCISVGNLGFRHLDNREDTAEQGLQWFVLIPKSADLDAMWSLRDDPWVRYLRENAAHEAELTIRQLTSPKELLASRKSLFPKIKSYIKNFYSAIRVDHLQHVFAEHPSDGRLRDLQGQQESKLRPNDNSAKEQELIGEMFSICADAGQIFRPTTFSDWGIDGEIEFRDFRGQRSAQHQCR
jgi:hypothetical protein